VKFLDLLDADAHNIVLYVVACVRRPWTHSSSFTWRFRSL